MTCSRPGNGAAGDVSKTWPSRVFNRRPLPYSAGVSILVEIAEKADVSVEGVVRVLTREPVSDAIKERVLAVLDDLTPEQTRAVQRSRSPRCTTSCAPGDVRAGPSAGRPRREPAGAAGREPEPEPDCRPRPPDAALVQLSSVLGELAEAVRDLRRETDAERRERVDDLAVLIDLITTGWQGLDARLGRIERQVSRLESGRREPVGRPPRRASSRGRSRPLRPRHRPVAPKPSPRVSRVERARPAPLRGGAVAGRRGGDARRAPARLRWAGSLGARPVAGELLHRRRRTGRAGRRARLGDDDAGRDPTGRDDVAAAGGSRDHLRRARDDVLRRDAAEAAAGAVGSADDDRSAGGDDAADGPPPAGRRGSSRPGTGPGRRSRTPPTTTSRSTATARRSTAATPTQARLTLPTRVVFRPGSYRWIVRPGFGARAARNLGEPVVDSPFTVS